MMRPAPPSASRVLLQIVPYKRDIRLHFEGNKKDSSHLTGLFQERMSLFMSIGTLVDINSQRAGRHVIVRRFSKGVERSFCMTTAAILQPLAAIPPITE
jgi:hypothetical protein